MVTTELPELKEKLETLVWLDTDTQDQLETQVHQATQEPLERTDTTEDMVGQEDKVPTD